MTKAENMPILGHLEELRNRIIKAAAAVIVGSIVAFVFREQLFDILVKPWNDLATERDLAFFRPGEAFSLFMRLSLFGGFVLASPVVIWQTWAFISPALNERERRFLIPGVLILGGLFIAGILTGYWALQRGLSFLIDFGGDSLVPTIGGSFYLSFAMRFILVFGIAFEFPVFLFAAAAVGAINRKQLAAGRRWAVLIIVVVGAAITPSGDPLTLLLLSVPLYLLYEGTLLLIRFVLRK